MDLIDSPNQDRSPGQFFFFDLSDDTNVPDNVVLAPGVLAPYSFGLRAFSGDDTVVGSLDSESLYGNRGDDIIEGMGGNDLILGGRDDDRLDGNDGDDVVSGNLGNDLVRGGAGNDVLVGGKDSDLLIGGLDNDTLSGDFGADALKGDAGSDVFRLRRDNTSTLAELNAAEGDADMIIDFNAAEGDRIALSDGLTEADLIFFPVVNQPVPISEEILEGLEIAEIPLSTLDPEGDGLINATLIGVVGTTDFIGAALNVTAADLSGNFVSG